MIKNCQKLTSEWLKQMGLELKTSKTKIVHTLEKSETGVGFDFLGFNIRQYQVGKYKSGRNPHRKLLGFKTIIKPSKEAIKRHTKRLKEQIRTHRALGQEILIKNLNPIIKGWSNYYSTVVSKLVFNTVGTSLFVMLYAWAKARHPHKGKKWIARKYWRIKEKGWIFQPSSSDIQLYRHSQTKIKRHAKVESNRSPFDGDWVYWSTRLGRHPEISTRVAKLLKRQKGKCSECKLFFKGEDVIEIDHIIPKKYGGLDIYNNLQLLHRHCHDKKTAEDGC